MRKEYQQLQRYRIAQAEASLAEANLLFSNGMFRGAVNRAYYAMFYSVLALLVPTEGNSGKHRGVISLFDREFVKTGKFDRRLSKWLHTAFNLRQSSDYEEMVDIKDIQTKEVIDTAHQFVAEVKSKISL